ncbi:hypothetical protein APUTEX25_000519 [Auxenochlorella protothecoides]|uniref:TFIIS N-terminal domain-containing protein n=3 Tax=Auxenochlorella protothecoides TaxID=3075 RepID=A0A3M7L0C2_AUXPR|nr:hypothetical protein APUTEX25_000519 [Auxenochlorella protothecoides]|eukprot:RMZ55002.1 hypothetical protein APUTEX25_000519 [Auxenochlorella protothecoides]
MAGQQRTLLNLSKVVRLDASTVCFTPADIQALRTVLLDPFQSKHDLLCALRKLDCYRLELADLTASGIGAAVATLTGHPKPDVARFAAALLCKLRAVAERGLFPRLPYDRAEAAAAPDGQPQTPKEAIAIAAQVARAARRARRLAAEADFLDVASSSSSDEDEGHGARGGTSNDGEWRPGGRGCAVAATPPTAPGAGPDAGGVARHVNAARYAPDSAFRKTRAGSRVAPGTEQGADGRLYRQATLASAFCRPAQPAAGPGLAPSAKAELPGTMVVEEELVVVGVRPAGSPEPMVLEL